MDNTREVLTLTTSDVHEGTLGARLKENDRYCLWLCAHVLTNFKENIGDLIYVAHHREYEYKYYPVYTSKK